jgi:hypothetical protein
VLKGLSVKGYIIKLFEPHWVEMKKRILPKGK